MNYFSNDDFYRKGIGYYYSLYSNAPENLVKGDIAPDYLLYPNKVIKRLRYLYSSDISDLRFVVYLKNPVVRLLDDYLNNRDNGLEDLSLENAIEREKILLQNQQFTKRGMSLGLYLSSSRYYSLLKPWLDTFSNEQFFFITDIDLDRNSEETISRMFNFLGVNPNYVEGLAVRKNGLMDMPLINGIKNFLFKDVISNGFKNGKPVLDESDRLQQAEIPFHVSEMLYDEVERLEQILGQKFSRWFANAPGIYTM